ncbi:MAG: hypothetical protein RJA99_555 [Pseudomonadota bacterium]|jgi:exopolysaccharide/PEP-CTERM locus tyrosine autokinase
MSMIERALSRLGDEAVPTRGSVTDLSAWTDPPARRSRRPGPVETDPPEGDAPARPPRTAAAEASAPHRPARGPQPAADEPPRAPAAERDAPSDTRRAARPAEPRHAPRPRRDRASGETAPPVRLDVEALVARGFVAPDGSASRIANEFRVIKRPLIANATGRSRSPVPNGRRVMVTSANPDEGKTFCSINLALSIAAERDLQVLLVDADVALPSLQRELRLRSGPGLMDLLADPSLPLERAVRDTDVERLAVMTAGTVVANATELLASDAMGALLDLMSERFPDRILVFDAPPLLPTTEARVLASNMGQIALVVEAGVTPQDAVEEALAMVESCPVVGLLLNKADERRAGGYGYGYRYGHDAR